ncbi:ATP-binding protein [Bacillus thuringiensis]|uniref:ATP-binding protein n=1 Tax=Bacillus thuringiensis TaxID=1428 RepID=UPI000BF62F5F|nr:ATP-binding protein [Bacillus thuringiensis]MED3526422.1 AAA family ATPase [Bacillus thuringiensis]PFV48424.1 hypothetical protein COL14_18775 [Bacillus thuringiensis]
MINNLTITNWNQFNNVNIDFHPKVTIITGTNGSGKSTIVRLISRNLGWNYTEIATPIKLHNTDSVFSPGIGIENHMESDLISELLDFKHITVGSLTTEEGIIEFHVPNQLEHVSYALKISSNNDPFKLHGVSVASHRFPFTYSALKSIPVKPITTEEAYFRYNGSLKKKTLSDRYYDPQEEMHISHMKATLMSWALFGQDSDFIRGDKDSYRRFKRFVDILKILLPKTLGFNEINIRDGELILITDTGDFLIDSVSGGIGAIIDLAWQIYLYDKDGEPFLVVIDEIENHLHPSMQRSILPNLTKAFPNAQFIVTTHSPFVVNSVANSYVYALKYNNNNKVCSYRLDFNDKSSNALGILRDILGVPVTLPIWLEEELNTITRKYKDEELTAQTYKGLKNDLSEIGLSNHLPQALDFLQRGE